MGKSFKYFILVFAILFTAQSCKKDDEVQAKQESKIVQGAILGVNGPTSGLVNQELTFDLVWQNPGQGIRFDHLKDSSSQNTKFIKLYTLTNVPDTLAKADNIIPYTFRADSAGTYFLKFYRADNSEKMAIIDTIIIK